MGAYLVLMRLCEGAEHKSEYVCALTMCLTTWSEFHDGLPGCCFSEEFCEASFSRLSHLCRSNPNLTTPNELMNLFSMVQPGRTELKDLPGRTVDPRLNDMVRGNLHRLVDSQQNSITYVP